MLYVPARTGQPESCGTEWFEGLNDLQDSVPVTMVDLREETLDTVHSVKSPTSLLLLGVGIN